MSNLRLSSWVLGLWSLVSGLASYALAKTQDQRPKLQLASSKPLYLLRPLHVDAVVSLQILPSSFEHQRFGDQLVQRIFNDRRSGLDLFLRQPPFSDSREGILSIGMLEQVVENRSRDMRSPHLIHLIQPCAQQ